MAHEVAEEGEGFTQRAAAAQQHREASGELGQRGFAEAGQTPAQFPPQARQPDDCERGDREDTQHNGGDVPERIPRA